jgi:hypothetical protein
MTNRLIRLLPDANRLVVRTGNDEVRPLTDRERPDLTGMTSELLDALELCVNKQKGDQFRSTRSLRGERREVKG